jgi:phage-related protein
MARGSSGGPDIAAVMGQLRSGVAGVAAVAAKAVTDLVGLIRSSFAGFVGAFRPDVVQRFDRVAKDLYATIGEALVPVMLRCIDIVRWMGDTFNGLYRIARPLVDGALSAVVPLFQQMGEAINQYLGVAATAFLPILQQLVAVTAQLAPLWGQNIQAITEVAATVVEFQSAIAGALLPVLSAVVPLVKVVADVVSGLLPIVLMPFKILAAVVGPLVQAILLPFTTSLQILGAILQPFAAVIRIVGESFGEIQDEVMSLVGDALTAFMAIVNKLRDAFGELFEPVRDFVSMLVGEVVAAFKQVVQWVRDAVNQIRDALGLPRKDGLKVDGNSVGKGAVGASFGSPEDMWKKVAQTTMGMSRGEKLQQQQANDVSSIKEMVRALPVAIGSAVAAAIRGGGQVGATAAAGAGAAANNLMADMVRMMTLRKL